MVDTIEEFRPLIGHIAKSACRSSPVIDTKDLCQIGELAALKAIEHYDPSCGTSIRSFVSRIVKRDIYDEAARFLGVFTVDRRITALAAKVNRLTKQGLTDLEIATELTKRYKRSFDEIDIRDFRFVYTAKNTVSNVEPSIDFDDLWLLLEDVIQSSDENVILKERILGNQSAKKIARKLKLPVGQVYRIERSLKDRIRKAIYE